MTIPNVVAGALIDPAWGNDVTDMLNNVAAKGEWNTFTPTLTNVTIGTGGGAANEARYVWVGGDAVNSEGLLLVSGNITLGTSGFSMGASPQATIPSDFESRLYPMSVGRIGIASLVSANIGTVSWVNNNTVGFTVFNSGATYLSVSGITSTVPATWAAGHFIRYVYTTPARRI